MSVLRARLFPQLFPQQQERPLARLVLAIAILLLGALAAWRLPLNFLPESRFPELSVYLSLPDASDPLEVTRRWIVPLESALRSLGEVRGVAGQVGASGGFLRVRFSAGTDPERKAARLESELTSLRRQLSPGAQLQVAPASSAEGDLAAVIWLGRVDDDAVMEMAEKLRAVQGVRRVRILGRWPEEIRVQLPASAHLLAGPVRTALGRALGRRPLGTPIVGQRHQPLSVEQSGLAGRGVSAESLKDLPIPVAPGRALPLGQLADIETRRQPPGWLVHYRGQRGMALQVWRENDTSPLLLEHRLTSTLGPNSDLLYSEAEPLRALLVRLACGLLLASSVCALLLYFYSRRKGLHTRRMGLASSRFGAALACWFAAPLALALALNGLWLIRFAGVEVALDVLSLPCLILGVCSVLPLTALRWAHHQREIESGIVVSYVLSALAVPVGVALASGALAPLLRDGAVAFALGVIGALLTLPFLPAPSSAASTASRATSSASSSGSASASASANRSRTYRLPTAQRGLQGLVRHSPTVVLVATTFAFLCFSLFGDALDPRSGTLRTNAGEVVVELTLPEGSTTREAEARTKALERRLDSLTERRRLAGEEAAIASHWSVISSSGATLFIELHPRHHRPDRRRRLLTRLRYELARSGQAVTVDAGLGGRTGGALNFDDSLDIRPETDEDAFGYRFLLRSTDGAALRQAWLQTRERLLRQGTSPKHLWTDWGVPSQYLELQPYAATVHQAEALAMELRRRSSPPSRWRLPGSFERWLTLHLPGYPKRPEEVPSRFELLHQPLRPDDRVDAAPWVAESLVQTRELQVPPALPRRSGRFELAVSVRFPFAGEDMRLERRDKVHSTLALVDLPPGTDLERPEMSAVAWRTEELRLLGLALAVPLLWLAGGILRLDSFVAGLATLAPPTLGLAAATPLISQQAGHVDEFMLLSLVGALGAMQPAALEMAAAIVGRRTAKATARSTGVRVYRPVAATASWWWWSALGVTLVLWGTALVPRLEALLSTADSGQVWRLPLLLAAVAATMSLVATSTVLPALLLLVTSWRQRDRQAQRIMRHPPAWRDPASPSLEVRHLTKIYSPTGIRQLSLPRGSGFSALRGVSFQLGPGITGLLGPNGAGKTTLLRLLTGLLEPSRGTISFEGIRVQPDNRADYRKHIGFLPQEFNAYPDFTAEQFLDYWALEKGIFDRRERHRQIEELLAKVGLEEHASRRVRDFSGGMRQRAGIARALLANPPILIVDEPTTGLDIESRDAFRQTLLALAEERIILFSTHIASDVDASASRILLLHHGRLRFDGSPSALIERARGRVFSTLITDEELRAFQTRHRITARVRTLHGLRLRAVARPGEDLPGEEVEPNLEEAYLTEIDRVETATGRPSRQDRFAFLEDETDDSSSRI